MLPAALEGGNPPDERKEPLHCVKSVVAIGRVLRVLSALLALVERSHACSANARLGILLAPFEGRSEDVRRRALMFQ